MANRFDKTSFLNLERKHFAPTEIYTPDFNMWSKVLEKQQATYNQGQAFSSVNPQFIQEDEDVAKQWIQNNKNAVDKISALYTSGDPNAIALGNKAMSEHASRLKQDMSAGTYYKLNKRKQQYDESVKNIMESNKDNPELARTYGFHVLKSGIKAGDLDQEINSQGVGKWQDYERQLREAKAAMDANKETKIQVGDKWITTTETEGWSPQRRKEVFDAIANDAKNEFTINANAWADSKNIDKTKYAEYLNSNKDKGIKQYDMQLGKIDKALKTGDKREIAALQGAMKQAGIDVGNIDGVAGDRTKQGVTLFKSMIDAEKQKLSSTNITPDSIDLMKVGKDRYIAQQFDYFNNLFGSTSKEKIEANPYGLIATKASYAKKQADYEHQLRLKEQFIPAPVEGLMMPDKPLQETRVISNAKQAAEAGYKETTNQLQSGMKDLTRALGLPSGQQLDESTYVQLMKIKNESKDANGKINPQLLQQKLAQQGQWWTQTFNSNKIAQVFDNPITESGIKMRDNIEQGNMAFESRKVHQFTINQANDAWNSARDAALSDGTTKAAWQKEFQKYGKRGETLESFISETLASQGQVNSTNRFYEKKITPTTLMGGKAIESEHNVANEILNRINTNTNNKMENIISKTMPTYRYTQNDKTMPMGELSNKVSYDIGAGLFSGYGMNGQAGLKWEDANGKSVTVSDPTKLGNTTTSFINTPNGLMMSITTELKDGKETRVLKSYSDVRDEVKPTVVRALKSEAFQIQKTNPAAASELLHSARMLENGASSMPNFEFRNSPVNSANKQIPVAGKNQNYNITDNISNNFIDTPVEKYGMKFGLKRVGFGESQRTVIVQEGIDSRTGKKIEQIIKLRNGQLDDSGTYDYKNQNAALKELDLFHLNNDDDIKQEVEMNRRKAGSSSEKISVSTSQTGSLLND